MLHKKVLMLQITVVKQRGVNLEYLHSGRLEIDINLVEDSIRPVAVGRKNYLFAGSHAEAERAAMIYSLLGSCKPQNIDYYR